MTTTANALARYFALVDGDAPKAALDVISESVRFSLARPECRIEGSSRGQLAQYFDERPSRGHRLLEVATVGDIHFVLGESVEGPTSLGSFIAAAQTDADGLIDRYVAAFYPALDFRSRASST